MKSILLLALVIAQQAQQTAPPVRQPPPTRDPHTPGFVEKKELADGAVPPVNVDGNFIIGPTHNPAPETLNRLFTGDHSGKLIINVSG